MDATVPVHTMHGETVALVGSTIPPFLQELHSSALVLMADLIGPSTDLHHLSDRLDPGLGPRNQVITRWSCHLGFWGISTSHH